MPFLPILRKSGLIIDPNGVFMGFVKVAMGYVEEGNPICSLGTIHVSVYTPW